MISPVPECKSCFVPPDIEPLSAYLSSPHSLGGSGICHRSHCPKADTYTAAIIWMIHKVQSAAAHGTVIGDFNHLNFQKVLEHFVLARH